MASVHRVKKSRFWYGLVTIPPGKRIFRSTGETEKSTALAVALQWERIAKGPPKTELQARRVVEDIIRLTGGVCSEQVSCRAFADRWLKEKEGTVSNATYVSYKQALTVWLKSMGPAADRGIDTVRPEQLIAWRTEESKRVAPGTVNLQIKAVRLLLKAAGIRFGFQSPATEVKRLKKDRDAKKRRPFTRPELQKLLEKCHGPWKLMVLLGLQTGQRIGDIARMRWEELDQGTWCLSTRKTATKLRIPLSKEVIGLLVARKAEQKPAKGKAGADVFPELASKITDKGVGRVSNEFGRILFKAGLRDNDPHDERDENSPKKDNRRQMQELSFHSLRHTARTWLEEAGQPKAVIDAFIGHEGDTGKIYTTVGEEALRSAAAALAAAGEVKQHVAS